MVTLCYAPPERQSGHQFWLDVRAQITVDFACFIHGWLEKFLQCLQQGSPKVTALLARNPFPDRPPQYVRALNYRYTFASPEQRQVTGLIWNRENPRILVSLGQ